MLSKQTFTLIAATCFIGLVFAAEKPETGVEILSKKHEIMDQIKRGTEATAITDLTHFVLDSALTLDTFVKSYAEKYISVDCLQGILALFLGEFDSIAVCIASLLVYLITSAIGIGLKLIGAKGWHFHLPFGLRDSDPYLEIEHFGNKVRYDTVGVPYEDFVGKRDGQPVSIDLPTSFDVSDVRVYTNYVGNATSNSTFNTISYSDEYGTHVGIENTGDISSFFSNLDQEQTLTKRGSGTSITFSIGHLFDITTADAYDALKGTVKDIHNLAKYFEKPQSSYCLELQKDQSPLINGELFFGSRGQVSPECADVNSYSGNYSSQ